MPAFFFAARPHRGSTAVAKEDVSVTMMLSPEAPHDTYGDDDGSCSIDESLPMKDGMFCRLSSIVPPAQRPSVPVYARPRPAPGAAGRRQAHRPLPPATAGDANLARSHARNLARFTTAHSPPRPRPTRHGRDNAQRAGSPNAIRAQNGRAGSQCGAPTCGAPAVLRRSPPASSGPDGAPSRPALPDGSDGAVDRRPEAFWSPVLYYIDPCKFFF
jgi:hypothetical protein